MSPQRLVIVTDCNDVASNELRAKILSELENVNKEDLVRVEPIVHAKEFSIINGAFLVRLMAEVYNPSNTIFLVILNPLSTSRKARARLIGETKNGFRFVGANTGTLGWLFNDFGLKRVYESSREGLKGEKFISFGGKHVHAPIAAHLAAGWSMEELSEREFDIEKLVIPDIKEGTVVHIDNFDVPKIYGELNSYNEGDELNIKVNGNKKCVARFTRKMKALSDGAWALYPGSSLNNLPEIGKVRSLETATELDLKIGDVVSWEMIK